MRECRTDKKQKKDGFLSGVLILSLSTVIVKMIGLLYKIPMLRLLGSEGMGYFNSAYELYTLFCTIATAGLPVAMSVMISGCSKNDRGRAGAIFKTAMYLFLGLGTVGSLLLFVFAAPFASFLGEKNAYMCICAISPALLFVSLSGAYRGYSQGRGSMKETAISQLIEALGKLALGLTFAVLALKLGAHTEGVSAAAALGLTLGSGLALCYLSLSSSRHRTEELKLPEKSDIPKRELLSGLLKTALPITLSSAVISLTKVIDMTMILKRLQGIGFSASEAFSEYGSYTTLALPVFSLAPALISAVALPLIPSLSSAVAMGDKEGQNCVVEKALSLTALLSMPISLGMAFFPGEILELLFHGENEAIREASLPLAILGMSVVLSCLITVGNAILQAYGRPNIPILSMAIGSAVKILLAYTLIGIPEIGLVGAPVSTFFCDLIINLVNFIYISRSVPRLPKLFKVMILPAVSALLACTLARLIYGVMISEKVEIRISALMSIAMCAVIYFALLLLLCGKEAMAALRGIKSDGDREAAKK